MRFGSLWLSPGRRQFTPDNRLIIGSFTTPWLWIEHVPTCQTVIWGGRPGRDIWVGSIEDRRRERYRRRYVEVNLRFQDAFGPTLRKLTKSFNDLAAAYEPMYRKP